MHATPTWDAGRAERERLVTEIRGTVEELRGYRRHILLILADGAGRADRQFWIDLDRRLCTALDALDQGAL